MILVISSKKVYAAKRLREEAGIKNVELRIMSAVGGSASGGNVGCKIMDVADLLACGFKVDLTLFDVLYIRDPYLNGSPKYILQIIKLAKKFKRAGKRVVDSVIVDGELGQGKLVDYYKLREAGLPIPKTTCLNHGRDLNKYGYPFILKWVYGFKAKNVFLINNQADLKAILSLHPKEEWLVQEFIKAEYEYKVITVGYKALPVVLRFKILDSGFRTDFDKYNVIQTPTTPSASRPPLLKRGGEAPRLSSDIPRSLSSFSRRSPADLSAEALAKVEGGKVVGVDKIKKIVQLAEQSSLLLSRELAKVDILESKGKFYILEVNRFPGLRSFEELTLFNVTAEFISYLQNPAVWV